MVEAAHQLGTNRMVAIKSLKETLLFMIQLNSINSTSIPPKPYFDSTTTVGELVRLIGDSSGKPLPGHPPSWKLFFADWLRPFGVVIEDDFPVTYQSDEVNYIKKVSKVLAKYENRPHIIANYLGWTIVQDELRHLNQKSQQWPTQFPYF